MIQFNTISLVNVAPVRFNALYDVTHDSPMKINKNAVNCSIFPDFFLTNKFFHTLKQIELQLCTFIRI